MSTSIKERLSQKVQIIKERDGNSDYRVRQKDKEADYMRKWISRCELAEKLG